MLPNPELRRFLLTCEYCQSKYDTSTKAEIAAELKASITGLFGKQISMPITPQEEELVSQ